MGPRETVGLYWPPTKHGSLVGPLRGWGHRSAALRLDRSAGLGTGTGAGPIHYGLSGRRPVRGGDARYEGPAPEPPAEAVSREVPEPSASERLDLEALRQRRRSRAWRQGAREHSQEGRRALPSLGRGSRLLPSRRCRERTRHGADRHVSASTGASEPSCRRRSRCRLRSPARATGLEQTLQPAPLARHGRPRRPWGGGFARSGGTDRAVGAGRHRVSPDDPRGAAHAFHHQHDPACRSRSRRCDSAGLPGHDRLRCRRGVCPAEHRRVFSDPFSEEPGAARALLRVRRPGIRMRWRGRQLDLELQRRPPGPTTGTGTRHQARLAMVGSWHRPRRLSVLDRRTVGRSVPTRGLRCGFTRRSRSLQRRRGALRGPAPSGDARPLRLLGRTAAGRGRHAKCARTPGRVLGGRNTPASSDRVGAGHRRRHLGRRAMAGSVGEHHVLRPRLRPVASVHVHLPDGAPGDHLGARRDTVPGHDAPHPFPGGGDGLPARHLPLVAHADGQHVHDPGPGHLDALEVGAPARGGCACRRLRGTGAGVVCRSQFDDPRAVWHGGRSHGCQLRASPVWSHARGHLGRLRGAVRVGAGRAPVGAGAGEALPAEGARHVRTPAGSPRRSTRRR